MTTAWAPCVVTGICGSIVQRLVLGSTEEGGEGGREERGSHLVLTELEPSKDVELAVARACTGRVARFLERRCRAPAVGARREDHAAGAPGSRAGVG
eukprot:scaffold45702_cov64-Phaeocystis_antarctica.AAC.1